MSTPLVGHLDPSFVEIVDEVQELLRYAFRTDNEWTIPVFGTGSAAMEAAIGNVVEPGETMLVPTNGYFGDRMASMARRAGGEVCAELLERDDLEIASGLGDLAGEVFRIGCVGQSARPENVLFVVTALADVVESMGADVDPEAGVGATRRALC